jgi:hypothetical protein
VPKSVLAGVSGCGQHPTAARCLGPGQRLPEGAQLTRCPRASPSPSRPGRGKAFTLIGLTLLAATVAATVFNWSYVLPQLVLLPSAAAVGLTALTRH